MHGAGAWCSLLFPNLQQGPDSVSLFSPQRSQASHPLLPPQPLVLQLVEHLLVQPQPEPQLRQLQHQPQPQPDSQPPQPLAKPQPQPQLQQPQQLGERRLLSPAAPPPQPRENPPRRWKTPWGGSCKGWTRWCGGKVGGRMETLRGSGRPPSLPGCFGGRERGGGGMASYFCKRQGGVGRGGQAQSEGTNCLAETLDRAGGAPSAVRSPRRCFFWLGWTFLARPKSACFCCRHRGGEEDTPGDRGDTSRGGSWQPRHPRSRRRTKRGAARCHPVWSHVGLGSPCLGAVRPPPLQNKCCQVPWVSS